MPKEKKLKKLFLSSIHQNAGKTTVALGLHKMFKEHRLKTTFIKPVGQQFVDVNQLSIDKDSYLMSEVYHCRRHMKEMSPVTVGRGFTEKYVFNPKKETLYKKIVNAFNKLTKGKEAIIIEGTGHAGVGSVIDFSNAEVAKILGAKVIIISEGGIGKSIDEIMLNKALFDLKGVEILGVIVNKVLPEKYKKIKRCLTQGLKNKNIPLLGVIPMEPLLISPTVAQIKEHLKLKVLCGEENLDSRIKNTIVAAMEPHNMIHYLGDSTLVLLSGDRVDNIMVAVSSHLISKENRRLVSAMILTGDLLPDEKIINMLKKSQVPVLVAEQDTYTVAAKVEHLICKIQKTDKDKIAEATKLIKKNVDFANILKQL